MRKRWRNEKEVANDGKVRVTINDHDYVGQNSVVMFTQMYYNN